MSNYLLSLHVNFAARKSSQKNVSESGLSVQPYCAEWPSWSHRFYKIYAHVFQTGSGQGNLGKPLTKNEILEPNRVNRLPS